MQSFEKVEIPSEDEQDTMILALEECSVSLRIWFQDLSGDDASMLDHLDSLEDPGARKITADLHENMSAIAEYLIPLAARFSTRTEQPSATALDTESLKNLVGKLIDQKADVKKILSMFPRKEFKPGETPAPENRVPSPRTVLCFGTFFPAFIPETFKSMLEDKCFSSEVASTA